MKAIITLDNKYGYSLFGKRLSWDREIEKNVFENLAEDESLFVSPYTMKSFSEPSQSRLISPIPDDREKDITAFFEVDDIPSTLDELIVYRWNRNYPSDKKYNPYLHGWKRLSSEDFPGHSHNKITREVYVR